MLRRDFLVVDAVTMAFIVAVFSWAATSNVLALLGIVGLIAGYVLGLTTGASDA